MASRIKRVINEMKKRGLRQMIVSDPKSIWYLTGISVEPYERLFVFYMRDDGDCHFFLNKLFVIPETEYQEHWYSDTDKPLEQIAEILMKGETLGVDKEWSAKFLIPLMELCPGMKVKLSSDCVDYCRSIKDAEEISKMRKASAINDQVIEEASSFVKIGMTERSVADFINKRFLALGCDKPSFTTIVSFGANAADPHHEPDETVLKKGECVLIDMGCIKDRYCSDMTRTFFCGEPGKEQAHIYELVRKANEKAISVIKPGIKIKDIDAAARDLISDAGYGEYFNHRLGHFIGQTDHEAGDVSSTNESLTEPGMIFSVEPGIYIPGKYGVRIEDLVLVTDDGVEVLNKVCKQLKTVGE